MKLSKKKNMVFALILLVGSVGWTQEESEFITEEEYIVRMQGGRGGVIDIQKPFQEGSRGGECLDLGCTNINYVARGTTQRSGSLRGAIQIEMCEVQYESDFCGPGRYAGSFSVDQKARRHGEVFRLTSGEYAVHWFATRSCNRFFVKQVSENGKIVRRMVSRPSERNCKGWGRGKSDSGVFWLVRE
ncbi:MAG: hypothetical protein AB7F59_04240 [Bdellovibrionales bacterium]